MSTTINGARPAIARTAILGTPHDALYAHAGFAVLRTACEIHWLDGDTTALYRVAVLGHGHPWYRALVVVGHSPRRWAIADLRHLVWSFVSLAAPPAEPDVAATLARLYRAAAALADAMLAHSEQAWLPATGRRHLVAVPR